MKSVSVSSSASRRHRRNRRSEWPTLAVAAAIYATFAALTWFYAMLPLWFLVPAAAYVVAWHGSLQHEVIHGHPTRWRWFNELLVLPSLWLWLPWRSYRASHIAHHHDERLTDPLDDPESWYLTPDQWQHHGRSTRTLLWVRNTVAGRLLLGPIVAVLTLWREELPCLLRGDRDALRAWALHGIGCALVLAWAVGVCGIPILHYILFFAYTGTALTLLRSFAEHRAAVDPKRRSVIVEASWPMALLYLNNNLHALHHHEPGQPWYRLPARYRSRHDEIMAVNGNYHFRGYAEIMARYLLWPKESVVHPLDRRLRHTARRPG